MSSGAKASLVIRFLPCSPLEPGYQESWVSLLMLDHAYPDRERFVLVVSLQLEPVPQERGSRSCLSTTFSLFCGGYYFGQVCCLLLRSGIESRSPQLVALYLPNVVFL